MAGGQERSTSTALPTLSLISGSDANGPDVMVFDRIRDASANMSETHVAGGTSVFPCEGCKCQFILVNLFFSSVQISLSWSIPTH